MAEYLIQDTTLTAIADAIRSKTGGAELIKPEDMASQIRAMESGGVVEKDINFYDYDGTLLYAYSLSDLPLSALPELPDHSEHYVPLTGVGWNFTLAEINALTGPMNIGALYVPTDGETKIHISLTDENTRTITLNASSSKADLAIDWGDGLATTYTGANTYTHTYASTGDYIISLKTVGTLYLGYGSTTQGVFGVIANTNRAILATIKAVYVANHGGAGLRQYAFSNCTGLESITLPRSLNAVGDRVFQDCAYLKSLIYPNKAYTVVSSFICAYCYSLKIVSIPTNIATLSSYSFCYCYSLASVTLPIGVSSIGAYAFTNCRSMVKASILGTTSIGQYAFKACYSLHEFTQMGSGTLIDNYGIDECVGLQKVTLPSTLTTIGQYALRYAYPMTKLTIPASVTSIKAYAFASCFGMKEYHFERTTPPTLENATVFDGIPSGCKIYVPSASLSTYKKASYWSTYASYMVGE